MLWIDVVNTMMAAHQIYKQEERPANYLDAIQRITDFQTDYNCSKVDWLVAGKEWLHRRYAAWRQKELK
jgi:hypothetical protein